VVAADPNLALGLFVDFNNFRRQQEAELERELEAASRRRSELVEEARKEAKRSRERREEQRRDRADRDHCARPSPNQVQYSPTYCTTSARPYLT
jgi:hypothetical protein